MNLVKRILSVAFSGLLVLGVLGGVAVLGSSVAHADVVLDEARFVQRMNADRASVGAPPLMVSARLVEIARSWSRLLGERSVSLTECLLAHNQNLLEVLRPASKAAENVGCGDADADALHNAFISSPHHRSNILDPSFDSVGVGVVMIGDTMFVTVEFVRSVAVAAVAAPTLVPLPILVPVPTTVLSTKVLPAKPGATRALPAKSKSAKAPSAKIAPRLPPAKVASQKFSSACSRSSGACALPVKTFNQLKKCTSDTRAQTAIHCTSWPRVLSKASALRSTLAKKGGTYALVVKGTSRLLRSEGLG
jgi:Cysteine-rich secretory protein family